MNAVLWEVRIGNDTDASSGVYDTKLEAMNAVDEAAAVDGLTARYGDWGTTGFLADSDGYAWFHFEIHLVDKPDEYVILALDSGDTHAVVGWANLVAFACDRNLYVDGRLIRDNLTGDVMYSTAVFKHETEA